MSYLETLRRRRTAAKAVEHILRMSVSSGKYRAFLIVEGEEDEEFYSLVVEEILPTLHFQTIVCDGKGGVLGLRDFADTTYPQCKSILYFIDRDHDDFVGLDHSREDTYVTDGYSVEWDVCRPEVLQAIFRSNYTVAKDDPLIGDFMKHCDRAARATTRRFRSTMAMVVAVRREDQNPDLDRLTVGTLFKYSPLGYRRIAVTLVQLAEMMELQHPPSWTKVLATLRELRGHPDAKFVRGKMIMSLYLELLTRFASDPARKKANGRGLKAKVQIGKKNFVHLAMPSILVPDSLRTFLEHLRGATGPATTVLS